MVVHGHARFPIHAGAEAGGRDFLFGRAVIAHARSALVHARHAGASFAHTVIDDDTGLEAAHIVVKVHAALVGPGAFPFAVKPQNAERAVAGEQLLELGLHVGGVAVHVGCAAGLVIPGTAV